MVLQRHIKAAEMTSIRWFNVLALCGFLAVASILAVSLVATPLVLAAPEPVLSDEASVSQASAGLQEASGVPLPPASLLSLTVAETVADRDALSLEDFGQAAPHILTFDGVWERNHAGANVGLEINPWPRTTLKVAVGFDGFLGKGEQFDASVLQASWQRGFRWGEHELELEIGKTARRLGRGRIDTLLMSGELPGFPQVAYSVAGPRYRYEKLIGDLGTADRPYKRLTAHRLTYDLTPSLSVGLAEILVRSEPFPGDVFYDVLPGLPLYLSKYVPGSDSASDNHLIYVDAEYDAGDWLGYGEVIFNEFPAGLWLTDNPPLFGVLLGLEMGPWLAEYSLLTNYAYSNGDPGSRYSHEGRSLGHWMGADGDALEVRWTQGLASNWQLAVGGFHWRKGEGKVDDWYASREEREENAFLSGVVERTIGAVGAVKADLDQLELTAEVRAGVAQNYRHQEGKSEYVFSAKVGVSYPF
ncbi:MAG TPA: hypothetical protein VK101_03110 [Limnochordia bacterium]|nr:hypothetical protein [Limnochordia bacterium]